MEDYNSTVPLLRGRRCVYSSLYYVVPLISVSPLSFVKTELKKVFKGDAK